MADDEEPLQEYLSAIASGWCRGRKAKPLFGIEWNKLWDQPVEELRDRLLILPKNSPKYAYCFC